jgi:acyl-CoA dehydrogenase
MEMLDFGYTDEQRMIREFVADLAKKYDRKYWLQKAETKEFPHEMWDEIARNGYFGLIIPEEYGGGGGSTEDLRIFIEELGRQGIVTLHFISFFMDCILLMKHGNEQQKKKFLTEMASGTYFSFAITEPNAGTNSFKIKTEARKEGDYYVLNGQKLFITGANESKYMIVITRTTPYENVKDSDKRKGFSLFVVDSHSDGITKYPQDVEIVAPERQYTVFFDNVKVPAENLIGEENEGFSCLFSGLNLERIIIASYSLGIGKHVLDKGVRYAKERILFDAPIGSYQAIQHPLSRAMVALEQASLTNQMAARLADQGEKDKIVGRYANIAKLTASEAAFQACDTAIQVHGGSGLTRDYDVITFLPIVRALRIAPVNNEMVLNYISEHQLGLPKSY